MNRIEQEKLAFFTRVRARYLTLAQQYQDVVTIDASQSIEQVKHQLETQLAFYYPELANEYQ